MMTTLKKLFEPITISGVQLPNRVVMLAMGTGFSNYDMSDSLINYYVERAKGGAGLIIVPTATCPGDVPTVPGVFDDRFIPGFRRLTQGVKPHGTKILLQLLVPYRWSPTEGKPGEVVGPSEMLNKAAGVNARPLTISEINQIVVAYGEGARRAREAGFDGVEVHMGMGFLLSRFLSTASNKRTDQYGGSLENRMHIILEIIDQIKKKTSKDYLLSCRFSADEFMEGGHTLKESVQVAPMLEAAGVHMIDVQAGWEEAPLPLSDMSVPRGAYVYLAEEIKKVVHVPVVTAYRINDPVVAEEILAKGQADLIGMARALVADPYFPKKAREGKLDDIRRCIACNNCLDVSFEGLLSGKLAPTECAVNPRLGKEAETALVPAKPVKKVLVVGGGPGGMEAAQVAAQRGHKVTLIDNKDRLGGQLLIASLPPHKEELSVLADSMAKATKKAGVEVRLKTNVTSKLVAEKAPDVVILATGASPRVLDIPGAKLGNVVSALDVLTGQKQTGNQVVIVGGGMVGCETAEFLVQKGKRVTILEMLPKIGNDIGLTVRWIVLGRLKKAGVRMETKVTASEITDKGVKVSRGDASEFFPADTVVVSVGMCSNAELFQELQGKAKEIYLIGDCGKPSRIRQAISEGFEVARKI